MRDVEDEEDEEDAVAEELGKLPSEVVTGITNVISQTRAKTRRNLKMLPRAMKRMHHRH